MDRRAWHGISSEATIGPVGDPFMSGVFRLITPDEAQRLFSQCWDIDLQMLRALVQPRPATWPTALHDLNAAARSAGVEISPHAPNRLPSPAFMPNGTGSCSNASAPLARC